ncbi:MAG: PAS domain S-box protein [Thermodesulfobacteriota bacterium]
MKDEGKNQAELLVELSELRRRLAAKDREEDRLRESEEDYRALVENLRVGVYRNTGGPEGRFLRANPALVAMFGFDSPAEFLQVKVADLYQNPQDRRLFFEELKERGTVRNKELRLRRKDGTPFWASCTATIKYGPEGEVKWIDGVIEDVTDRKRAEEELRLSEKRFRTLYQAAKEKEEMYESLLNSTPDAVTIYNFEGETQYINQAFTQIFGFTPEEVLGRRIPFVPEAERERSLSTIREVLEGRSVSGFETRRLTKDGRLLDITLSSSCYHDHEGKPAGIVAILRDVTEAKQMESQLRHAQKMEAIGTLAGGIAHDFNNLLQAVQGYAQLLLLNQGGNEAGGREIQEIIRAAQGAGELTQRLLTFSRKVESELRPVNLNHEVRQTHRLLLRTIPKMIEIETDLKSLTGLVLADAAQVQQVIMNLALNAKDAMPGGGRLVIETEDVVIDREYSRVHLGSRPGRYVLLSVTDTGLGMDKETLDHIFEPFFTTKAQGQGTGLGLAMVYGIVRSHQGFIHCYSEPGRGTVFKVYLPASEAAVERDEEARPQPPPGGDETILLVEDEEAIRELVTTILTQFGYEVLPVPDGETALEMFRRRQGRVDLVVLDLIMPGMGGLRCLEELLKIQPGLKVIISSGYSERGRLSEAHQAGARGFIKKPFDIAMMLTRIREILDGD